MFSIIFFIDDFVSSRSGGGTQVGIREHFSYLIFLFLNTQLQFSFDNKFSLLLLKVYLNFEFNANVN